MPRLNANALERLSSMIQSGKFTLKEMAIASDCSASAVVKVRDNWRRFGTARSPHARGAQLSSITQPMRIAMKDLLSQSPYYYLEEIQGFLLSKITLVWSVMALRTSPSCLGNDGGTDSSVRQTKPTGHRRRDTHGGWRKARSYDPVAKLELARTELYESVVVIVCCMFHVSRYYKVTPASFILCQINFTSIADYLATALIEIYAGYASCLWSCRKR